MSEREWPVHRTRAWLLRKAAELIEEQSPHDGQWRSFIMHGNRAGAATKTEENFRWLLETTLDWHTKDVDRAVVEIYGEAPRPRSNLCECPSCHGIFDLWQLNVSTIELHPCRGFYCPLCGGRLATDDDGAPKVEGCT
jgi:hypothetical protein